jgi:hypothetical protein
MQTEHPERCTHKLHELPRWLSAHKVDMIKNMLNEDPSMFLRETMGICAESTTRAFNEACVKRFESRRFNSSVMCKDDIYISIDPAGGGNSAYAICSLKIYPGGMYTVCRKKRQDPYMSS